MLIRLCWRNSHTTNESITSYLSHFHISPNSIAAELHKSSCENSYDLFTEAVILILFLPSYGPDYVRSHLLPGGFAECVDLPSSRVSHSAEVDRSGTSSRL